MKVTIFLTDMTNFGKIVELRRRWFTPPYPADTIVEVSALALPELEIEIEAIAVAGRSSLAEADAVALPARCVVALVGSTNRASAHRHSLTEPGGAMSEKQLVDAYLEGRIDRRRFIQRLVGAGVSVAIAVTYADLLHPQGAGAGVQRTAAARRRRRRAQPHGDRADPRHRAARQPRARLSVPLDPVRPRAATATSSRSSSSAERRTGTPSPTGS